MKTDKIKSWWQTLLWKFLSQVSLWWIYVLFRLQNNTCHHLKSFNYIIGNSNFHMTGPSVSKGLILFFTLDPSYEHWKSAIIVGL